MAGIEQDIVQTLTREQVMKARDEDEKKIRLNQIRIGIQGKVKGYSV